MLLEVAGKACLEAVLDGPQVEPTGMPHFSVRAAWSVQWLRKVPKCSIRVLRLATKS